MTWPCPECEHLNREVPSHEDWIPCKVCAEDLSKGIEELMFRFNGCIYTHDEMKAKMEKK